MWEKVKLWFQKFWGIFLGLAIVIGVLANILDIQKDFKAAGSQPATSSPIPTAAPSSTPLPTASPMPTMGPFQFLLFPKQARAGDDFKIILQAATGSVCHLDYYTPDGNLSAARGLGRFHRTVRVNVHGNGTFQQIPSRAWQDWLSP